MRITGGKARGIRLSVPGRGTRPATDRMREALFSRLRFVVEDGFFLDLFAGTGAYGLEALSRGAKGGILVESNRLAVAAIGENLKRVERSLGSGGGSSGAVHIIRGDAFRWRPQQSERFDMVFLDPPYGVPEEPLLCLLTYCRKWLSDEGSSRLVVELPGSRELKHSGWELDRRLGRGRGDSPTACIFKAR